MTHKGQIVKKVIDKMQIPIQRVADATNISRRQMYNIFSNHNVNDKTILKIGKAINHDFSEEFPSLKGMHEVYPEYKTPAMRFEEQRSEYLTRKTTAITVYLDGSDEKLEEEIEKMRRFNEVIKSL